MVHIVQMWFLSLEYFSKVKCPKDIQPIKLLQSFLNEVHLPCSDRPAIYFNESLHSDPAVHAQSWKKFLATPSATPVTSRPPFFLPPPPPPQHPVHTNSCTVSQTNSLLSVPSARLLHLHHRVHHVNPSAAAWHADWEPAPCSGNPEPRVTFYR